MDLHMLQLFMCTTCTVLRVLNIPLVGDFHCSPGDGYATLLQSGVSELFEHRVYLLSLRMLQYRAAQSGGCGGRRQTEEMQLVFQGKGVSGQHRHSRTANPHSALMSFHALRRFAPPA